jgi:alpha-L-fucosidase
MFRYKTSVILTAVLVLTALCTLPLAAQRETREQYDARRKWWREARFGLFLHWGLYAVPAETWNGKTNCGERPKQRSPMSRPGRPIKASPRFSINLETATRTP